MIKPLVESCPACGAQIVWAISLNSVAWAALEAEPDPEGTMMLEPGWDGRPRARPVAPRLRFGRKHLRRLHATICIRKDQLKAHIYSPPS